MRGESKTTIPLLINLLADEDRRVGEAAADALGDLGPAAKAAVPALTRLIREKADWNEVQSDTPATHPTTRRDHAGIRGAAASSLGNIGPEAKTSVPELGSLLFDKEVDIRRTAAAALAKIGDEAAARVLSDALSDEDALALRRSLRCPRANRT